jgi:eukaryotic-like serine/threonine-protein kinase
MNLPSRDLTRTVGPEEQSSDSATLHEGAPGPGSKIGRYVVLERVGSGAMGVVYAAYDPELDRKVALKLLHGDADRAGRRRAVALLREARAMARLTDPNVIGVHDVGSFEGAVFVAMEFVEGQTLTRWLRTRRRAWHDILDVLIRAGRGLRAAHRAGLVHADFKPDNVMVTSEPDSEEHGDAARPAKVLRVQVTDFGLARAKGHLITRAREGDADDEAKADPEASHTGIGTPAYMSPEQHLGMEPDARSDQFSFCVALYEALHGHRPFEGQTFFELAAHVIEGRMREPPRDSPVPARIRSVISRGLSNNPDDRFASMDALLMELERAPAGRARRPAIVLVGLGGVVVLGATAFLLASRSDEPQCAAGSKRVGVVWSDAHRRALREAFAATPAPFSTDAAQRVERALDGYADAWAEAHKEACEATYVHREQSMELLDRRMGCLGRALADMRALIGVLEEADEEVVQRAAHAVMTLPDLRRCADERLLLAEVAPPPEDELRAVESLRDMLARAHAFEEAGRYRAGLALTESAVLEADALRYLPVQAEA